MCHVSTHSVSRLEASVTKFCLNNCQKGAQEIHVLIGDIGVKSSSSPHQKKSRFNIKNQNSTTIVMLFVFFAVRGTVRNQSVPRCTTAKSENYKGVLEHLRIDVCRKDP